MRLIQVLGTGCTNCALLLANAQAAVDQLGIEAMVEKITDMDVITGFRVMATPALAVDGEIKVAGRVASVEELKKLLA